MDALLNSTSSIVSAGLDIVAGSTAHCWGADIALLPFFERFKLALQLFQGYDLADAHGGAITQWMGHLQGQPWCQTAAPNEQKLAEALRQHKSLDFFDYVTYDAFTVHPHLLGSSTS
ncbi:hypothetical protein COO60DRAFT_1504209 [Scenedesmus sp. NREL 46B-D3]|nr:hypothetical protein COO60DRAFT_1504209 [Scenedesmus sp. NREL 46B-D3]